MTIDCFDGDYAFLSNFYNAKVTYNGLTFDNSESAYQSCKAIRDADRMLFVGIHAGKAKRLGKKMPYTKSFHEHKLEYMRDIVYAKFTQNEDLRDKLLSTGDAELIEGNYWHDTFWGVCNGEGENHLGRILMDVRRSLRERL